MAKATASVPAIAMAEIAVELDALWERFGDNLSIQVIVEEFSLPIHVARAACDLLVQDGRAKWYRRPDRVYKTIVQPDFIETGPKKLTELQQKVLDTLVSLADEDMVAAVAFRQIAEAMGQPERSGLTPVIDSLDGKGYLQILERGLGSVPNIYKLYPAGDGPAGPSPFRRTGSVARKPENCETCNCSITDDRERLICRRFPPDEAGWPFVEADDWCAEWRERH